MRMVAPAVARVVVCMASSSCRGRCPAAACRGGGSPAQGRPCGSSPLPSPARTVVWMRISRFRRCARRRRPVLPCSSSSRPRWLVVPPDRMPRGGSAASGLAVRVEAVAVPGPHGRSGRHRHPLGSMRMPRPARIVVKVVKAPRQPLGSIMPPRPFGSMMVPAPARRVVFVVMSVLLVSRDEGRFRESAVRVHVAAFAGAQGRRGVHRRLRVVGREKPRGGISRSGR